MNTIRIHTKKYSDMLFMIVCIIIIIAHCLLSTELLSGGICLIVCILNYSCSSIIIISVCLGRLITEISWTQFCNCVVMLSSFIFLCIPCTGRSGDQDQAGNMHGHWVRPSVRLARNTRATPIKLDDPLCIRIHSCTMYTCTVIQYLLC